jgi:hypothetical protein
VEDDEPDVTADVDGDVPPDTPIRVRRIRPKGGEPGDDGQPPQTKRKRRLKAIGERRTPDVKDLADPPPKPRPQPLPQPLPRKAPPGKAPPTPQPATP